MPQKIIRTLTVLGSLKAFLNGVIDKLTSYYDVVLVSSPGSSLDDLEQTYGVKTIGVKMNRRFSPLYDIVSLVRLVLVFIKEKPDMVHSMTPKAGLLSMLAAWITRVPVRMHTFTGLVFPTAKGFKRKVLILTDKITCVCATHINPEGG